MRYRLQDGIVYTKVAKVHLLVATRKAWDRFAGVREVSALQGAFCEGISRGMEEEEIIQAISRSTHMKEELIRKRLSSFIGNMEKMGYIVPEDE